MRFGLLLLIIFIGFGCAEKNDPNLFQKKEKDQTNIDFTNQLDNKKGLDIFRYRNFYNGGGVGMGDFNNDGWTDIYFVSNQNTNRLYFNKGDFTFKDVTSRSGVGGSKPWSTGVTIADVNSDGWLDIYVSNSGDIEGGNRANELFINKQNGTFAEEAAKYGLADDGFSTHASFFDYDQDGDLDCYVLNNSFRPVSSLPLKNTRNIRDEYGGDRFYENQDGRFVDISEEAGIYGPVMSFGLAVTLLDANEDGWTDMYISNDFFERDYLYINRQGNGFSEQLPKYMDQISLASMGTDAEDLNNDGLADLFITEMLPKKKKRLKQVTSFESVDLFRFKEKQGFHKQFMRNTLQLNNGDGSFSEIGRYAGLQATGWSWGSLIFDMDNNGNKDVFVSNGVYRDVTNQDFLEYFGSEENLRAAKAGSEVDFNTFVDKMPSTPIANYAFSLDSALTYQNQSPKWGLDEPSFSNGLSYGDLDNDGDLDLVINNLNQQSFVYENNSDHLRDHHYLKLELRGEGQNTFAIGAKVVAYIDDELITVNNYPARGFQSTVDNKLIIGLGKADEIDSLEVRWNHQMLSSYYEVPTDTTLQLSYNDAKRVVTENKKTASFFTKVSFNYSHVENFYQDFSSQSLMHHRLSMEGPAVAKTDINKDGLDDFFVGGAVGHSGKLFINKGSNLFRKISLTVLEDDKMSEDVDAAYFDANNDGFDDLYVVSGGNEYDANSSNLKDRLYIFTGMKGNKPQYKRSKALPELYQSGSTVRPADYDFDGDMDLFVGNRSIPGQYGRSPSSALLENDGTGTFENVTPKYISQLENIGMVTDAAWSDYDGDDDLDLLIVGDWMPIVLFENRGDFFQRQFEVEGLTHSTGWWNTIYPLDVNRDGRMDYIIGNQGLNSRYKTSKNQPLELLVNDFDRNGTLDHIYTYQNKTKRYPYHLRDQMVKQLPFIETKFPTFKSYADKDITHIFSKEQLHNALQLKAEELRSVVIINKGPKGFKMRPLPKEAQYSPIFDIIADDFNSDQEQEVLMVGNFSGVKPSEGFYDANHGQVFQLFDDGTFGMIDYPQTGLKVRGDARNVLLLRSKNNKTIVIGKNDDNVEIYSYQ